MKVGVEELNLDWGQFTGHVTINVNTVGDHDSPILLIIYDDRGKVVLQEYYKQALIQVPISILYKGVFHYKTFVNGKLIKSGNLLI